MIEKFAAIKEVHDHIKFVLGLKSVVHLHQKRTLNVLKDLTLGLRMIYLVSFQKVSLLENLHRVILRGTGLLVSLSK